MKTKKRKAKRGFAAMSPEKRREIARKGGQSVKPENRAFAQNRELAASAGRKVALTIDDGTCAACVDRILNVLEATGGKATLFPNGTYGTS